VAIAAAHNPARLNRGGPDKALTILPPSTRPPKRAWAWCCQPHDPSWSWY